MTKTITIIVTWGDHPALVNVTYHVPELGIIERSNKTKTEAQKIIKQLKENYPDYDVYYSPASQVGALEFIGE